MDWDLFARTRSRERTKAALVMGKTISAALQVPVSWSRRKLSDLDITVQDEALDKLVRQGVGVKVEDAPVGDLTGQERPISADPFPPSYGAARQQDPDKVFGKATSLPAGATDNETQPVRKPS